jgi:heterodisulfide reductase subunit A
MVILATAILPNPQAKQLADVFKIPLDSDGFFQEAHAKVRPVDFSRQGIFVAGLAHYPKPVEESITQALAAAARATTLLAAQKVSLDGTRAEVHVDQCDGCALCIDVCPFNAITLIEVTGKDKNKEPTLSIAINKTLCTGCGICQGTCPKRGVSVAGFTFEQINDRVTAALTGP